MKEIWISPSDLSFLWSDNRLGFYDKYVGGVQRPPQTFPAVFRTIDSLMKAKFDNKNIKEVVTTHLHGVLKHNELDVRSELITLGDYRVGFKGQMDSYLEHDNGEISIIDYKTTSFSENLGNIYLLQLMAYMFAIEKPLYNKVKKVNELGLIVMSPCDLIVSKNNCSLQSNLNFIKIDNNKDKFKHWLANELKPLLHSKREDIFISSRDQAWENYLNSYLMEEKEE